MATSSSRRSRGNRTWLVALAVSLIVVAAASQMRSETLAAVIGLRFAGVEWVETKTLALWMNASESEVPVLLDVRSEEEFAVSHLRGAIRIEPGQRSFELLSIDESRPVVVYCSVGYRSAAIVDALRASGIGDVRNLRGGIFAWANEGRPVFRNGQPVSTVHPYDPLWGFLLRDELRARVEKH